MVDKEYLENLKADVRVYKIKSSDVALEELLHRIQKLPLNFELDVVSNIIKVQYTYQTPKTTSSSLISITSSCKETKQKDVSEEEQTIQFLIKKINAAMPLQKQK